MSPVLADTYPELSPATPGRFNKRPRRAPSPAALSLVPRDSGGLRQISAVAFLLRPPPTPPLRAHHAPLRGFEYGPQANTCPVDTLLTLARFALTPTERRTLAGVAHDGARGAWRALLLALRRHQRRRGDARDVWYRLLAAGGGERFLPGRKFGVVDQIVQKLLPDGVDASPLHFRMRWTWRCAAGCGYGYVASAPSLQLPLLLSLGDVAALLAAGVPREVGALVAAHLGAANASIYEACPSCAAGPLKARAAEPQFSDLLLVELDRGAALAPSLPWRLAVAPSMLLKMGGALKDVDGGQSRPMLHARYQAVAVVYNDGSHWWADLLRAAAAPYPESYRYDGLEAGGALRYAGRELTLTSDPRHISLVLYRRDRSS